MYNSIYCFNINTCFYYLSNENYNFYYASSAGTYCVYTNFNTTTNLCLIKIPSSKKIYVDGMSMAFCGRNANIFSKNLFYSSFKQHFILKKKKQSVRGVAMNPVDHPNGGSSKTKRPLRTP